MNPNIPEFEPGRELDAIEDLYDPIHSWFELSYAQYLTIPRSVLQSMPQEWQARFVRCLEELDETIDWRPTEDRYWVQLKDAHGRYVADPLQDYDRGRRVIPANEQTTHPPQTGDDLRRMR